MLCICSEFCYTYFANDVMEHYFIRYIELILLLLYNLV